MQVKTTPTKIDHLELIGWQTRWQRWWKPWPWFNRYEADEYGPPELWCGIWIFQFKFYVWRKL